MVSLNFSSEGSKFQTIFNKPASDDWRSGVIRAVLGVLRIILDEVLNYLKFFTGYYGRTVMTEL